ncbi:MAG: CPBP family intramembrane metalloprotease [Dehalococcoidia bacterium]|nr:CPBP family intramembrane metalloprotease [Dehalococcoidia bacterium]
MRTRSRPLAILITFLAILIIPRVAGQLANLSLGWLPDIDPDGVYLWISLHHVWQLILTIALMLVFNRHLGFWGFNLDNMSVSLRHLKLFVLYSTGFLVIQNVVFYFVAPPIWIDFPLTLENVSGYLGFQVLLSGTCEEPLFRGFVMMMLYPAFDGSIDLRKFEIPHAGLIAALFFTFAHIQFSIWPFEIVRAYPPQLVLSFVAGIYYAVVFHQTRSLLTPILAHNYLNLLLVGLNMLLVVLT